MMPIRASLASSRLARQLDDVLSTAPTGAELEAIARDFSLTFEAAPGSGVGALPASLERMASVQATTARASLLNVLRCLRELTFDAPLPVLGCVNLYAWLRERNNAIHVFASGGELSHAGQPMQLRRDALSGWWLRRWDQYGVGMVNLAALLVHEATHYVLGKPHDCADGVNDSGLEYGGAWAAQFWFLRWLGEHSRGHLTAAQKLSALERAGTLLRSGALSCGKPG